MSTCPRELHAMLHVFQQWSIRNCVQINTDKTKTMVFFEPPALLRARGTQHQPGPTMFPYHVYSPFPTSDPCSYLIHEVFQFEYIGLVLDPKLTMHLANVEAIRCASQGQALGLAVSQAYSLQYDKNSSQLTPTQKLGLWKAIVLPHCFSRTCGTSKAKQILRKCKLVSTCPWLESCMHMATTLHFWQIQESQAPLYN